MERKTTQKRQKKIQKIEIKKKSKNEQRKDQKWSLETGKHVFFQSG